MKMVFLTLLIMFRLWHISTYIDLDVAIFEKLSITAAELLTNSRDFTIILCVIHPDALNVFADVCQVRTFDLTLEIVTDMLALARDWDVTTLEDFTNEFIEISYLELLKDPTSLDILLEYLTTDAVNPNKIFVIANAVDGVWRGPRMLTIYTNVIFDVILVALINSDSDPEIFRIYHETVRNRSSLSSSAHLAP
jgi:hypothetical protein